MADSPELIIGRIERDLKLLRAMVQGQDFHAPRTGWRQVRGSHAISFVPDKDGRDVPPRSYGESPAL